MPIPRVLIVSPALADANNGNWHTAARWQQFLSGSAEVRIAKDWDGAPVDALIALHARRSAPAIARFAASGRPLAVVLTGTDVYRDIAVDASARHSLKCATRLVVLQAEALEKLDASERAKAQVIVQSAAAVPRAALASDRCRLVAVGHLRDEKDPLTLMRAACRLPADASIDIVHIGRALDAALGAAAERTAAECAHYRWVGGLPQDATRQCVAGAHALVHMSRMEGGANAVIEAVRSGVPVLASNIDGNVGLLGRDYAGYFPVGDDAALTALMLRFASEPALTERLSAQCALREPLFRPEAERAAVCALLAALLANTSGAPIASIMNSNRTHGDLP